MKYKIETKMDGFKITFDKVKLPETAILREDFKGKVIGNCYDFQVINDELYCETTLILREYEQLVLACMVKDYEQIDDVTLITDLDILEISIC